MLSEGRAESGKLVNVGILREWRDRSGLARREEVEGIFFKA